MDCHGGVRIEHVAGVGLHVTDHCVDLALARPAGTELLADGFECRLGNVEGARLLQSGHGPAHCFGVAVMGIEQQPLEVR